MNPTQLTLSDPPNAFLFESLILKQEYSYSVVMIMIINTRLATSPSLNINRRSQRMIFEYMPCGMESQIPLKHFHFCFPLECKACHSVTTLFDGSISQHYSLCLIIPTSICDSMHSAFFHTHCFILLQQSFSVLLIVTLILRL